MGKKRSTKLAKGQLSFYENPNFCFDSTTASIDTKRRKLLLENLNLPAVVVKSERLFVDSIVKGLVTEEELLAEANLAFVSGTDVFLKGESTIKVQYTTYVSTCIRNSLKRYLRVIKAKTGLDIIENADVRNNNDDDVNIKNSVESIPDNFSMDSFIREKEIYDKMSALLETLKQENAKHKSACAGFDEIARRIEGKESCFTKDKKTQNLMHAQINAAKKILVNDDRFFDVLKSLGLKHSKEEVDTDNELAKMARLQEIEKRLSAWVDDLSKQVSALEDEPEKQLEISESEKILLETWLHEINERAKALEEETA